jgi:hypothetical protein
MKYITGGLEAVKGHFNHIFLGDGALDAKEFN